MVNGNSLWQGLLDATNLMFTGLGEFVNHAIVNSDFERRSDILFSSVPLRPQHTSMPGSQGAKKFFRDGRSATSDLVTRRADRPYKIGSREVSSAADYLGARRTQSESPGSGSGRKREFRASQFLNNHRRSPNNSVCASRILPRLPPPPSPKQLTRQARLAIMAKVFRKSFWKEPQVKHQPLTLPRSTLWQSIWHSIDSETKKVRLLRRRNEIFGESGPWSRQLAVSTDVCGMVS